jgi:hypothetical protein
LKISLEPKELKELLGMLTPQVTVIDNGIPRLEQQSPHAPLPKFGEAVTAEADYFAAVAKYSEPTSEDKAAALAVNVANGFVYETPPDKPNGKNHSEIANQIAAAQALLPPNGN